MYKSGDRVLVKSCRAWPEMIGQIYPIKETVPSIFYPGKTFITFEGRRGCYTDEVDCVHGPCPMDLQEGN